LLIKETEGIGIQPMNITRRELTEIVAKEVFRRLKELREADDNAEGGDKKRKKVGTASADTQEPEDNGTAGGPEASTGSPDASSPDMQHDADAGSSSVDGGQPDPDADQDAEDALDKDGDAGEEGTGAVNDEISGKTVQAITINPKSKVMPGFKEVVLTFNETTDALTILVDESGGVIKFLWRNQLHDLP
jgi:hypothetical protein